MHERNIELCTQNLVAIGKAIEAYKKEHDDFPDWLSDLHPKHLADANTLICINEMPNLKRVYDTYKDQGFDIIGVSLDDTEKELRDYIKENDIQWRQVFSGKAWRDDPLAQQYNITGVPEQWLIDRDGTLISHKARGEELEHLVVEALKNKSANR